ADPCITRALGQAPTLAASEMNAPQGLDAASALLELAKVYWKENAQPTSLLLGCRIGGGAGYFRYLPLSKSAAEKVPLPLGEGVFQQPASSAPSQTCLSSCWNGLLAFACSILS